MRPTAPSGVRLRLFRGAAGKLRLPSVPWRLAPIAPIVLGIFLLAYTSQRQPYWLDEAYSLAFAQLPWDQLRAAITHIDAVFVFYYALLHVWLMLVPPPLGGRLLSALFSLLTLPIVYALGVRLYDQRTGLVASILYASTFSFLEPAREIRMYPLLTAAISASWLCLLAVFERPTLLRSAAYAGCLGIAFWVHPIAAFSALAQSTMVLVWSRQQRQAAVFAAGALAIAIAATFPLFLLARHTGAAQIGWLTRPTPYDLWSGMVSASGKVPAVIGILLIAWSGMTIVRERRRRRSALLGWLLIPPTAAFVLSLVAQPVFTWRYLVEIGPAASLLIAGAVMRLSFEKRRVALVVLAAISVYEVHRLTLVTNEDWSSVRTIIESQGHANEGLILYPSALSLSYRLAERRELRFAPHLRVVYPAGYVPAWSNFHDDSTVPLARYSRHSVWVIVQGLYRRKVNAALSTRYQPVLMRHVGITISIEHWIRRPNGHESARSRLSLRGAQSHLKKML